MVLIVAAVHQGHARYEHEGQPHITNNQITDCGRSNGAAVTFTYKCVYLVAYNAIPMKAAHADRSTSTSTSRANTIAQLRNYNTFQSLLAGRDMAAATLYSAVSGRTNCCCCCCVAVLTNKLGAHGASSVHPPVGDKLLGISTRYYN